MKIIVTGATGFIGSALVEGFRKINQDYQNNYYEIIPLTHDDIEITKPFELPQADVIYHFAGNSYVYKAKQDPLMDFRNNALGTLNTLKASKDAGIKKFIFASSVFVDEDSCLDYCTPYSISKRTAENYIPHYYQNYISVRITQPYGPGIKRGVIYDIINSYLCGSEYKSKFDITSVLDFIYIDDLVATLISLAEKKDERKLSSVAQGHSVWMGSLVNEIDQQFDDPVKIVYGNQALDIKVRNNDYYNKRTNLTDGIKKTIEYFKNERMEQPV